MKKQIILSLLAAGTLAAGLQAKSLPAPRIQLAILLDTSGSMDGLIDQARSRIWRIVNELASARRNGQPARLQVALYEYGQSGIPAANGYLRRIVPLSEDLDRISEELFKLRTNGGEEYCGRVIQAAVHGLEWSAGGRDLKMIVIAGNEPFTQGPTDYRLSCREAISRGIVVNTIFCGDYREGVRTDWKAGADLADGQYLAIDADNAPPPVSAPQDTEIARLGGELNRTYIAFGREGGAGKTRQNEQDKNAAGVSEEIAVQRVAAKAAPQYDSSAWDLVDAERKGQVKLEELDEAALPAEMKGMSPQQRRDHVTAMQKKRLALQKKIAALHAERERYVREQQRNSVSGATLDEAILRALRAQAEAKGLRFAE
ncbi:MAG: VWA domain-containing protein [Candidatus Aminicenantes bacterium]|nr:VWA domain-containing protein [Candidatus Aminicenantes bacterium]